MKKLFFILNIVCLLSSASYSSIQSGISFDKFTIPYEVKQKTCLPQDVSIYFSNITYDMPFTERSCNILSVNEIADPLEGYNRSMFEFNSFMIGNIFRPIGRIYSYVIPEYGRKGISKMYNNIEVPGRFINCLLQARFKRSGIELCRFFVNTTAGAAGFYDVAYTWLDMSPQSNSFGQTFAYWGIGPGFYFVIPIQGGSTIRDTIGLAGDWVADPITWILPWNVIGINWISLGIKTGLSFNEMTLVMDDYVRMYNASADPYNTLKSVAITITRLKQEDQETDGYKTATNVDTDKK
jgi:phospholipid-binding lipoprotein MlaA